MAWLVRDGAVVASVEVADGRAGRRRGLLGRHGIDGAMWLSPARAVHTLGMRFAIDVAFLRLDDDRFAVLDVVTMRPGRLGRPRWRASGALEASAGAFERWGIGPGDTVELRS